MICQFCGRMQGFCECDRLAMSGWVGQTFPGSPWLEQTNAYQYGKYMRDMWMPERNPPIVSTTYTNNLKDLLK